MDDPLPVINRHGRSGLASAMPGPYSENGTRRRYSIAARYAGVRRPPALFLQVRPYLFEYGSGGFFDALRTRIRSIEFAVHKLSLGCHSHG